MTAPLWRPIYMCWMFIIHQYDLQSDADEWECLVYDDRWRLVTVYKETSTDPILYELNVPHAAGADGFGGSSYIDSWALRERDKNLDETLETRTYYIQNWRADVISELTDALSTWTWGGSVRYSAYGEHEFLTLGDVSDTTPVALRDTVITIDDYLQVNTWIGSSNLAGDLDDANETGVPDGAVTTDDLIFEADLYTAGGLVPDNPRFLYAGYVHDPIIGSAASSVPSTTGSGLYHVRNRVYNPELGRWTRRDPLGYVDGAHLFAYCVGHAIVCLDASGALSGYSNCPIGYHYNPFTNTCNDNSALPAPPSSIPIAVQLLCCGGTPPALDTSPVCDDYPVCYSYVQSNARCFCKCAGNSGWSTYVRACLSCMFRAGIDAGPAHSACYKAADDAGFSRPWSTLADCYQKCVLYQDAVEENGCGCGRFVPHGPRY